MTNEEIAIWLVRIGAVTQTTFVFLYGGFSPWWRNRVGRALFTKALGLMLLLDLSLINEAVGRPYPYMEQVVIAVIGLVTLGSLMQLSALLIEKVHPTEKDAFGTVRRPFHTTEESA